MTVLVRMQDAQLAFGNAPLLDHAELIVESGERLCIVGRNGGWQIHAYESDRTYCCAR